MKNYSPSTKGSIIPPTSSKYLIPIIGYLYEGLDPFSCDMNRNFLSYISDNLILPDLLFKIHYKISTYCEKNALYIQAIEHLKFCLEMINKIQIKSHKEDKIKKLISNLIEIDKNNSTRKENKIYDYFKGNAFYKLKEAEDLLFKNTQTSESKYFNHIGKEYKFEHYAIKSSNAFYSNKQDENFCIDKSTIEDLIKNLNEKKIYQKFLEVKKEFSFYFKVHFISIYFS